MPRNLSDLFPRYAQSWRHREKEEKKNTGIGKKKKLPFGGGFRTSFFFSLLSQKRITCSSCIWNIYDLYQTTSIMKRRKTSRIDHNQSRHTQCRCQCYIYVCPIYSITMFSTLQLYTIYNCSVGGWQSSFRENTTQHQKARWQLTWSRCNWWLRDGRETLLKHGWRFHILWLRAISTRCYRK